VVVRSKREALAAATKAVRDGHRAEALALLGELAALLDAEDPVEAAWSAWTFEAAPSTGLVCEDCGAEVKDSPGGTVCANGHGGAGTLPAPGSSDGPHPF